MIGRSTSGIAACVISLLVASCEGATPATTADASVDTTHYAALETGADTATDKAADVALDAAADAGTDVALDASADATTACAVDAPTSCPDASPRYADLVPIFRRRCVTCHDGTTEGPWPLDTYTHIADWQREVRDELVRCTMPPADSGVMFPVEERDAILTWLLCGLPQ